MKSNFYSDKSVLVTGGTGFVGMHLVEALLEKGARVRVVVHKRSPVIQDGRVEYVNGDLSQLDDCQRVVRGVDFVFHAAGAVAAAPVTAANPLSAITTNLILTARMLQAATVEKVKRFLLFGSSTGYPLTDYPVKEEDFWEGPTHSSYFGYGWMRRYLERLGEFCAQKTDTEVIIVRPTAVYGRWDNFDLATCHVIPALIRRAVEQVDPFEVWGTGEEVRDFLHIKDLARGCLLMLEKGRSSDPVNIGYGVGVAIKDVVDIILKSARHRPAKVTFDTSKPTAIPFRIVDTSKAWRLLGFKPAMALQDGLNDTVEWYKETRYGGVK